MNHLWNNYKRPEKKEKDDENKWNSVGEISKKTKSENNI